MATSNKIIELYKQYMGFTPTSKDIGNFSMMSAADTEDVLSNSRSDVQSNAINSAQSAIAGLASSLPAGTSGNREYLEQIAGGEAMINQAYGIPEAEQNLRSAEEFYSGIASRGPMFEEVMRSGLSDVSPKFLGATRKETEKFFAGIPNPFVKDKMVKAYMGAADRSLAANLNALNSLYQTALVSAQTAMQAEQSHYNRVTDLTKNLYGELQWLARNRYQEQETERKAKTKAMGELEQERQLKSEGLGRYYQKPAGAIGGGETFGGGTTTAPSGGGTSEGLVQDQAGNQFDLTTPQGLEFAKNEGYSYEYLKGWMDTNTKLNQSSIEDLLSGSGFKSPEQRARNWEDDEMREIIREDYYSGSTKMEAKINIKENKAFSEADRNRALFILEEMWKGWETETETETKPEEDTNRWWEFWK